MSAIAQLTYVGSHVQHCVTWGYPHAMLEVRLLLEDLIPQKLDICLADAFDLQSMSQSSREPPPVMHTSLLQTDL